MQVMDADQRKAPRSRVLVTGAAGLVGRELCGALAERGHAVTALLHRATALARNDGTPIPTHAHGIPGAPGSVAVLRGDVTAPGLGLDAAVARELAAESDLVVHCAATTAFNLPAAEHARVNVGGTERVLELLEHGGGRAALLHVSTAYVCGEETGSVAEAPSRAIRFVNGYETSKASAEARVLAATGLRVAVARPSIVVGTAADGTVGAFGNLYQLLRLVADGHVAALPIVPGASLDLVPIDYVVGGLVDIAERMDAAAGRVFHLASGAPVPLALLERVGREFPGLRVPRFLPPAEFDPAALPPLQRGLYRRVTAHYASYLRPSPLFATANLRALSGRTCAPTDAAFVRRLIGYAVAAGFLAGGFQRTSG